MTATKRKPVACHSAAIPQAPDVPLPISQRVIVQQLGQKTAERDRDGIRGALGDLVQRLDVSSRPDSAVLVSPDALGKEADRGARSALEAGKQTLESTPAFKLN